MMSILTRYGGAIGFVLTFEVTACAPSVPGAISDDENPDGVEASSRPDPSKRETCENGLDDTGDGQIDEDCTCTVGATQPCWPGDPAQRGLGICTDGMQVCKGAGEFGVWSSCASYVLARTDIPQNGIDEDCSGGDGPNCRVDDLGEVCSDGVDNDCDEKVDCDDPDCAGDSHCCVPETKEFLVQGTYTFAGNTTRPISVSGSGGGGGGAGGAWDSNSSSPGNGGGGGAAAVSGQVIDVPPGSSILVTVGAGGAGGAGNWNVDGTVGVGTAGGDTTLVLNGATILVLPGGGGGAIEVGGAAGGPGGEAGEPGFRACGGTGGKGGNGAFGTGGAPGSNEALPGLGGTGYGSGGGGAASGCNGGSAGGGNGAGGFLRIELTCPAL